MATFPRNTQSCCLSWSVDSFAGAVEVRVVFVIYIAEVQNAVGLPLRIHIVCRRIHKTPTNGLPISLN